MGASAQAEEKMVVRAGTTTVTSSSETGTYPRKIMPGNWLLEDLKVKGLLSFRCSLAALGILGTFAVRGNNVCTAVPKMDALFDPPEVGFGGAILPEACPSA